MNIIIFVLGFILGVILTTTYILSKYFNVGSLRIDTSDPQEDPYVFLELAKEIKYIQRKKYVLLKINTKNYITRK
jgi:hypothetical protein